ncbi:bifunctional rhamnulose-1-phosphate aldolase/short-chain dehydrogenase [Egibacter rhizosphaerae]|uniref:Bifunctional rhamnulose-1-phosphate aldolase/short-chain dehydrogenase n=1 Tax=Egibacter rhizosphaerae TaxID=1670831 RepID=A0A411YG09_9ACTN|nr:bifunctional rhamnulose-1-phosphate aldolase/short-chain dehydrogenase [Egibacter rhizosphaerae]QBI20204.1 bifunctional rhamnulose-1-phosphate aldolase/short-chain dehydrogenase [Egibacter rhizosphaerae]
MKDPRDHPTVDDLVARSRRLGADPTTTNYGGGNTSAKGTSTDPVDGEDVEVMWVKGSGGDLGTLTREGLSTLVLDRVNGLKQVYEGPEHEDEMHELLDLCTLGAGAAPSIDTSMHALLPTAHVDHLHPDSIIALAAAADGEELTKRCFGDEVAWTPWRRPGFELARRMEELLRANPDLKGVVMGGHGLTTWGETNEACEQRSWELIRRAQAFLDEQGDPEPLGSVRAGFEPLPADERHRRAAALAPVIRGLASTDQPVVGHWNDDPLVLDFIARQETPRVVPLGTSCPDHFIRTKVRPLLLDLPTDAPLEQQIERLRELHREYREEYAAYYRRHADEGSPPMRGADPAIVLVPGVGMFSFGGDSPTARIAGEFYVNAINVIRGAESVSTYDPVPEAEKFRVEYWWLEEKKLRRRPAPKPLTGRVALVTGGGSGIGRATARRLAAEGAVVAIADLDGAAARDVADELGARDHAIAVEADVADETSVQAAVDEAVTRFGGVDLVVNNAGLSLSKSLFDTDVDDWDRQHDVMARGSFLVSRAAARVMAAQGDGGDIVYIASKNGVVAGPNNVAYGSAKASQAHQVRLLAAELGEHRIRVNGINPDGVVQGSGIFAGGWGAKRAEVYGVKEEELGQFYAGRTLLQQEVLPEHVAAAVFALVGGDLHQTTGLLVPVDSGLAQAFLR